jgi:alcohol dehydrogenase (cytochrome c)
MQRRPTLNLKTIASRTVSLALTMLALSAHAQSVQDLRNDASTPQDVTTYGMGWGQQRHSTLGQVTPANVGKLVPAWNLSLDNSANASSQPLLIGGVMYLATHSDTIALDPVTGRQKWKVAVELPTDINGYLCCGIQSRGLAALDGTLYRTTLDAHVVAISMADGKPLWKVTPCVRLVVASPFSRMIRAGATRYAKKSSFDRVHGTGTEQGQGARFAHLGIGGHRAEHVAGNP